MSHRFWKRNAELREPPDTLVRVHEFENPLPEEDAPGHSADQDGRAWRRVRRKEQPIDQFSWVHAFAPVSCLPLTAITRPAFAAIRWDSSHLAYTDRGAGSYIPGVVPLWTGNKP